MAFNSLKPLTVTDSVAVPLIDPSQIPTVSPAANGYESQNGYSIIAVPSASVFIGGSDVTNATDGTANASQFVMPMSFDIKDGSVPYFIAPTGQTVTINRLGQGQSG